MDIFPGMTQITHPHRTSGLAEQVAPYDLVMQRRVGDDEHVVMLCNRTAYAVCRVFPSRQISTSPNFHVQNGTGLLNAPLTPEGLRELLHWTDRKTALSRFTLMLRGLTAGVRPAFGSVG